MCQITNIMNPVFLQGIKLLNPPPPPLQCWICSSSVCPLAATLGSVLKCPFPVSSPGHPSLAPSQKPASLPSSGQTRHSSAAAAAGVKTPEGFLTKSPSGSRGAESPQNPDLDQSSKEKELKEEELLLLAKIHQLTGDTSSLSGPRGMKRLIPDPCEFDSDTTELVPQETSVAAAREPPANQTGRITGGGVMV